MIKKTKANTWQVRIFEHGRQRGTRTFKLKRDADAWERVQNQALQNGTWHDERLGKITLEAVVAEFNETRRGLISPHTWATDEANLRLHLLPRFRSRSIGSVRAEDISALLNLLLKKGLRQRTVGRVRDSMYVLWTFAEERRYVPQNVVAKSKVARGAGQVDDPVRPLTSDHLEEVIAAAAERNAEYGRLIEFLALTGLRWGEARELRVSDIQMPDYPTARVSRSRSDGYEAKGTKSGKPRNVPLHDRSLEIATAQSIGKTSEALLFTAPRGGQISGPNLTRAIEWRKITTHRIHDLRHTAATKWIAVGIPISTVSAWLGHADSSITMRIYAGHLDENDRAARALLAAASAKKKSETHAAPADMPNHSREE